MARTIRDAKLETRASRTRLAPSQKAYWKTLLPGKLHLGYRRPRADLPGTWLVRHYIGKERYRIAPLGVADDFHDTDMNLGPLSFAEAQRRALAHKAQDTPRKVVTVADAVNDYVAWLKDHRASGRDAERRATKLIIPKLGTVKLADLQTVQISDWRDALAKAPARLRTGRNAEQRYREPPATADQVRARRATANRTLTILKAALNRAFAAGHIDDDTAWRRVKPFPNTTAARPGFLSIKEAKRLIAAADAPSGFRNLVHAALLTGARYSELCALRVRDFRNGKVAIHRSKSGKPRDVVLTEEGTEFFRQVCADRPADAIMFPRADGSPWKHAHQSRPMREACTRAKIAPAVGFHQLRHTWASLSVMAGMPLMVVARNLGHSTTAMVERHYGHLRHDYIDDAIRTTAPRFGSIRPSKVPEGYSEIAAQ